MIGGALALAIRSELFLPGQQIFQSPNDFERFFTVHGTTMLLLWVIPFGAGIGNYLIPIMVRYKDMAWPKLNAVAYWMIPVAGALIWLGFSDTGWTAYPPYSIIRAAGPATDMWIFGMKILGSMPTVTSALIMMYTDRLGISGFFNPAMGGDPIAYQHLFWFTFHPEVYIFLIPAVGMAYELIPKFSRKPIFSYQSGVVAFILLGTIGFASWAHHMFATGMSFTEKTVFMVGTLAAVPASSMHVFNWIATMWGGRIKFAAPMLFAVGGIMLFFTSGAGGVVNTAMPLDFITHDSYFVVGHFHLLLMGTVSLIFTGFIYYLFPLITGRMYNEKLAKIHFVLAFVGIILVFMTQHLLGLYGMPRRVFDYLPIPQLIIMNQIASIGAWIVGPSYVLMLYNLIKSAGSGKHADMRDPFKIGEEYYDYTRREPHH
jgi:cytochrome c oxidase subunit 1